MTTKSGGTPAPPSFIAGDPKLSAQANAALSGSTSSLTGGSLTGTASMEQLLLGTSADVTGRYGMTGQPNYYGPMPTWLAATGMDPMKYIQAVSSNNYDPWYGVITNNGDDRVYMGREEITKSKTKTENVGPFMYRPGQSEEDPYGTTRTVSKTGHTDATLTVQQAMNAPLGWSEKKVADTIKKMNKAGFKVSSFDQMNQVWGQMVQRASAMYAYSEGQNKVTPWDVLTMYGKEAVAAGTIGANGQQPTQTTTTRTVADITQGDAWNALQGTLSQLLGRDPSDRETRDFAYRMNSLAAKNPTITRSVTSYDKNGDAHTQSSTKGGFDAQDLAHAAYNQAQSDPNYAEFQSATTYYNAAISALGAIGQVG